MSPARVLGGQLLPLAEQVRRDERLGREAPGRADIARNPSFEQAEIDRQRQQVLSGLQVSYDDPAYLAGVVFGRLVYGGHPYGMPHNGTPASVLGMTRDDLRAFHESYYAPNNALLGIVGDIDAEAAFATAERVFGDLERETLPPPPSAELPAPTGRVVVIDKPGSVQTAIRVGHIGLPRASPDYLAFDVAIKILGGEGGNRLGSVLRTERSLTYAASADRPAAGLAATSWPRPTPDRTRLPRRCA